MYLRNPFFLLLLALQVKLWLLKKKSIYKCAIWQCNFANSLNSAEAEKG